MVVRIPGVFWEAVRLKLSSVMPYITTIGNQEQKECDLFAISTVDLYLKPKNRMFR